MEDTMEVQTNKYIGNLQQELLRLFKQTHSHQKIDDVRRVYAWCINEEYHEWIGEQGNTPEDMKELCDLIWVCIQYANSYGYNLEEGFKELINEYNSKFYDAHGNYNPMYRSDGKLLKGAGFKKANFKRFFKETQHEG